MHYQLDLFVEAIYQRINIILSLNQGYKDA